ncbi:protein translocase subunit SecF [Oleispirillum naphthae]|uniref:protein translocase subunit SecF n=1 Tax=Oleispirillum naphthae TaxID=2838853 RepID=UPI0030824E15
MKFLPEGMRIDFVGKRLIALGMSIVVIVGSMVLLAVHGLNFGIDFAGGIQMEVRSTEKVDLSGLRGKLNGLGVGEIGLQGIGGTGREVMIRIPAFDNETVQNAALKQVREALGPSFEDRRTEVVGPKVGGELVRDGLLAVSLAILAIGAYLWLRFEWQYGVGGMLTLLHDVTATMGLFSITGMEFSLTSVAAVLTIAGYSINDTVVVYDRVRENLRKYKKMPLAELMNLSINEMLSRTILTSGTTVLSVVAIAIFGGEVLRGFALALIWGVIVGTYSSIYISLPVLIYFHLRNTDAVGALEEEEPSRP